MISTVVGGDPHDIGEGPQPASDETTIPSWMRLF
jgi:hypothetical protein